MEPIYCPIEGDENRHKKYFRKYVFRKQFKITRVDAEIINNQCVFKVFIRLIDNQTILIVREYININKPRNTTAKSILQADGSVRVTFTLTDCVNHPANNVGSRDHQRLVQDIVQLRNLEDQYNHQLHRLETNHTRLRLQIARNQQEAQPKLPELHLADLAEIIVQPVQQQQIAQIGHIYPDLNQQVQPAPQPQQNHQEVYLEENYQYQRVNRCKSGRKRTDTVRLKCIFLRK